MSAIEATMQALIAVVASLPLGTNLGLLHNFWAFVTDRLLPTRGWQKAPDHPFRGNINLLELHADI